jgi:hypothetical protein
MRKEFIEEAIQRRMEQFNDTIQEQMDLELDRLNTEQHLNTHQRLTTERLREIIANLSNRSR